MYTVVYYKTKKGFKNAYKNNAALIARSFSLDKMITYKTGVSISNDPRSIKRILQTNDLNNIPTGDIVMLVNDTNQADSFILNSGLKVRKRYKNFNIISVVIPYNTTPEDFKDELEKLNFVDSVTIDAYQPVSFNYEFTYNHPIHWYLQNMHSAEAWDLMDSQYSSSPQSADNWVEVAILDSQVAGYHPELEGKISSHSMNIYGGLFPEISLDDWSFTPDTFPACNQFEITSPLLYHGTGVAGVVAAKNSNNDMILSSGNDKVKVQVIALGYISPADCDIATGETLLTLTGLINGLTAIYENPKCVAVTHSAFIYFMMDPIAQSAYELIATQKRNGKGIPIFAAMGNDGVISTGSQSFLTNEYVSGVIASNALNLKAGFSNYGPLGFIAAPGENIVSLSVPGPYGSNLSLPASTAPNNYTNDKLIVPFDTINTYQSVLVASGTSSASPIAATVAATLMYVNPELTRQQVLDILAETARKTGESEGYVYVGGRCNELGFGVIDHEAAIQMAIDYASDPVKLPPWYQNLDTDVAIQITNAPSTINFQTAAVNIETLVTLSETILETATTAVIEFWIGLDDSFSSTYQSIGSYTLDSLSESMENTFPLFLNCAQINTQINQRIWATVVLYDSNFNIINWPSLTTVNKDSVPVAIFNECTTGIDDTPISIKYMGMAAINYYNPASSPYNGNPYILNAYHRIRITNNTLLPIINMQLYLYINDSFVCWGRDYLFFDGNSYTDTPNLNIQPGETTDLILSTFWNYDTQWTQEAVENAMPANVKLQIESVRFLNFYVNTLALNISSTRYLQSFIFS